MRTPRKFDDYNIPVLNFDEMSTEEVSEYMLEKALIEEEEKELLTEEKKV